MIKSDKDVQPKSIRVPIFSAWSTTKPTLKHPTFRILPAHRFLWGPPAATPCHVRKFTSSLNGFTNSPERFLVAQHISETTWKQLCFSLYRCKAI